LDHDPYRLRQETDPMPTMTLPAPEIKSAPDADGIRLARRPFTAVELRAAGAAADAIILIDPADPLVVRYADRSRGFSPAMDRIDRAIQARHDAELIDAARALGRQDAEDGLRRDPGLETAAECQAYCNARNARLRELADLPTEADREWAAGQHADAEGLTERDEDHFDIVLYTVSALDHLLDSIDDRADEAAAQDLYGAGLLPV
jgi:hypothetical protein